MTSVYVETYGCTLNQSESEELMLRLQGHTAAESIEEANVVVLNTCMVISTTEEKILKRIDTIYPHLGGRMLIITGCMVESFREEFETAYPASSAMQISDVASYIDAHFPPSAPSAAEPRVAARVKIAQGCVGSCSYCVVRLIKGRVESRTIEAVAADVEQRLQNGAKQIFLAAQDAGAYGLDQGYRLPDLIAALCEIKCDFKLRVGMMNVASILDIAEDLLAAFRHPHVYRFVHVPVQSGSDRILKLMGRGHTVSDFKQLVSRFRHEFGGLTLSTDFIVGFPTETEGDFQATLNLLREVSPLKVNITRFSRREGTQASFMAPIVSRITKERSRILTAEHHRVACQRNRELVGKRYAALAVEKGKQGSTILYNNNYRPVVVRQELVLGVSYAVRIIDATPTYLLGSLI